ncbi:MAG TPA: protein-L-isoaspartate(D-aspartate) O-methyltransferase [Rhodothermales bacterium]|nr:protein-L-isoaspartate(D-aspartate) O-methyltransferase [Rhodothermales bacterium]HRR09566.1 protein-L-isoaspartate(D-aspartate) O-methyltransferase [Rhodothermales bacterium]
MQYFRSFNRQRAAMVAELRSLGIRHEGVLDAIGRVERHLFLDQALHLRAYRNEALPIGNGQTISQPLTVALQTALLDPRPGDRMLEIGLGSGYQAAVLCEMGVEVYSIEYHERLWQLAHQRLSTLGYVLTSRVGDGSTGWPEFAPFDGVVVTAGATETPKMLMSQLILPSVKKQGGRLVVPIGDRTAQKMMRCLRKGLHEYQWEEGGAFRFVPFING